MHQLQNLFLLLIFSTILKSSYSKSYYIQSTNGQNLTLPCETYSNKVKSCSWTYKGQCIKYRPFHHPSNNSLNVCNGCDTTFRPRNIQIGMKSCDIILLNVTSQVIKMFENRRQF